MTIHSFPCCANTTQHKISQHSGSVYIRITRLPYAAAQERATWGCWCCCNSLSRFSQVSHCTQRTLSKSTLMASCSNSSTQHKPDCSSNSSSSALAPFSQVCTLLLQSQQRNCVQAAATFSRLLCVSKQLRKDLLHAAVICIQAHIPRHSSSARTDRSLVHWLCQHLRLGTIRHVEVDADDFYPDLYLCLAEQLQKLHCSMPPCEVAQQQQHHHHHQQQQQQRQSFAKVSHSHDPCVSTNVTGTAPHQQPPQAAEVSAACSHSTPSATGARRLKTPSILVSWHVCGLPPSLLHHLPGATLTHLTLRDSTLSYTTAQHLATLTTLRQLHLPNLNPGPASLTQPGPMGLAQPGPAGLAHALSALTALASLFIRHPQQQEQQALPSSLQRLTVAQRTPPWVDAAPYLEPLRACHLTALTSLTLHEWMPQGVTEQYVLPNSLQHLAAVCISSARPLLRLEKLHTLQLSSLKHSSADQLLQLSSLPALTAVEIGVESPPTGSGFSSPAGPVSSASVGPAVRLSFEDLRAYAQVFAAVPVTISALVVQQHAHTGDRGVCEVSLAALGCLKGLEHLSLEGQPGRWPSRPHCCVPHACDCTAVMLMQLVSALTGLTGLKGVRLSHLQLRQCQHFAPSFVVPAARSMMQPSEGTALGGSSSSRSRCCSSCGAGSSSEPGTSLCVSSAWLPALQQLAQLRSLRKLVLRGLPLGDTAVVGLTALTQLYALELHDCDVPCAVVDVIIGHLGRDVTRCGSVHGVLSAAEQSSSYVAAGGRSSSASASNNAGCGLLTCLVLDQW